MEIQERLARKINERFLFMKVTWSIGFLVLLSFFIYNLILIKNGYVYSVLFVKRMSFLLVSVLVFLGMRMLYKYIVTSIKNTFIVRLEVRVVIV